MSVIRCTGDDSTGFLDNHHEKDVSNMTLNSFCPRYTIFISVSILSTNIDMLVYKRIESQREVSLIQENKKELLIYDSEIILQSQV